MLDGLAELDCLLKCHRAPFVIGESRAHLGVLTARFRILLCMTIQVPVRLTEIEVAALDAAVATGRFPNRSAALRAGLDRLLSDEREHAIGEAYARGYAKHPQEEWIGEVGLAGLVAFHAAERGKRL